MSLVQRQLELSAHVVAFGRYLRAKGFAIGPDRESDALLALAKVPFDDETYFYLALRSVFPQTKKQLNEFDQLYGKYWKELAKAVDSKIKTQEEESKQKKKKKPKQDDSSAAFEALKNWLHGKNESEEEELASYSLGNSLEQKDFSTFTDDDLRESQQVIRLLVQKLRKTVSRRYKSSNKGSQLDLRKIMSANLRGGDEIVNLYYRQPARNKIKLVLICDVSKSMDLYSRFFVQFMYAFQNLYQSIETFVFSTQLCRITEDLKEMDYSKALENLSEAVPSWSGGTDLGVAFKTFADNYATKKLNNRTIVLIVSDGWDTGESTELAQSMAFIARKARRTYWLNPLANSPDYRPETKALKAIMPHIDGLLPAHNLDSLKKVVEQLR
jgi:uncharacterized protein